jgi:hypothetical protein
MKPTRSIAGIAGIVGTLVLCAAVALAQAPTSESEHEAHHPATQSQGMPSPGAGMQGMGMTGGQGMMGGKQMMGMPMMMPCCPCGMMGMGMMMGGGNDSGTAAKMMEMHAEMMKANAAIMEKYAKEMGAQK